MRCVCCGLLGLMLLCGFCEVRADDAPTIKSIMKTAFKDGLVRKVATGQSAPEERTQLLKLSQELQKLAPPKGEADSWKELTQAVIDAAQAAVDENTEAPALLRKATNCMRCHDVHKPE